MLLIIFVTVSKFLKIRHKGNR